MLTHKIIPNHPDQLLMGIKNGILLKIADIKDIEDNFLQFKAPKIDDFSDYSTFRFIRFTHKKIIYMNA